MTKRTPGKEKIYVDSWKGAAEPLIKATGWQLYSFDPDYGFRLDKHRTLSLPKDVVDKLSDICYAHDGLVGMLENLHREISEGRDESINSNDSYIQDVGVLLADIQLLLNKAKGDTHD